MISTLIELQRLKRLDRTGWVLRGLAPGAESVAAHSYGVTFTAMVLADKVRARGVAINVEHVLRLALLHDLAESQTGDMPRTAALYYNLEARRGAERAAFDDVVRELSSPLAEDYGELHKDYERRLSVEARLVKAADIIDLLAQALFFERSGARGLDEFWEGARGRDFQLDGAAREIVAETMDALLAARPSAK
ncbi:MAG TPA: HD family hydrolase [Pyrinomonadaceae bacterium]|jgi:putative hydrolase of HD superfamily|nr:HD family hydrolase [Pyrinomonadaceae bacterium]